MVMKKVVYDLRASEERMLTDWRHRNDKPIKIKAKKKKPKKSRNIVEINHAKGLSYKEFLDSTYWIKVRKTVLKRDKFECIVCHSKANLQVHHSSYKNHGFEHKHLGDLSTVCSDCHKIVHGII